MLPRQPFVRTLYYGLPLLLLRRAGKPPLDEMIQVSICTIPSVTVSALHEGSSREETVCACGGGMEVEPTCLACGFLAKGKG